MYGGDLPFAVPAFWSPARVGMGHPMRLREWAGRILLPNFRRFADGSVLGQWTTRQGISNIACLDLEVGGLPAIKHSCMESVKGIHAQF